MTFNLIADRWLPCRRASGTRVSLAPHEITSDFDDDPILALDFPRPDWNAAVTELLIGLLSIAQPPVDAEAWAARWITPPDPEALKEALAPLTFAFNLDGDGPRCFQDVSVLADGNKEDIESLLMNAPAGNNRDLFVKTGSIVGLSMPFATAALITLQTYAPGGGRGHMANPRKKGPLSIRPVTQRPSKRGVETTLWDQVWPSVMPADALGPPSEAGLRQHLPWFIEPTSQQGGVMTAEGRPAWALLFTQPRRLALEWTEAGGCPFSTEQRVCSTYRTRPKGHRYEVWRHPLSSYRVDGDGEWKCIPTPLVRCYEDWTAIWAHREGHHPPLVLSYLSERLQARQTALDECDARQTAASRHRSLAISGIVADRMLEAKVLGWLEERIPYFEPPPKAPDGWSRAFQQVTGQLVEGAREAAGKVRNALQIARFGKRDGEHYKLVNAPKDAFDEIAALLWRETEEAFVRQLETLRDGDVTDRNATVRTTFLPMLRQTALSLFDNASNIDTLADQDARRLVYAKKQLVIALSNSGDVAKALGLVDAKPKKGKKP